MINGLIFNCPFLEELDDCPFRGIRKLLPKEKINYILALTLNEEAKLIKHHRMCLARRESTGKINPRVD